ncbi:hypothetical protein [Synechococcus sp. A15-44]|nr:hypothetical protein [Synechococcus sp. A15-44]QNI63518.1 hypothetical protein SynA1544_00576 [Synechococcus sp. A15-44]
MTQREDWPRDAVGVRCPGGDPTSSPDEQQPSQCCYALCPGL